MAGLDDERVSVFVLALLGLDKVSSKTVGGLLEKHGPLIASTERLDARFADSLGSARVCTALSNSPKSWEELEDEAYSILERARCADVSVLNPLMGQYPSRLARYANRPPVLFCAGDAGALDGEKAVAVVGTRQPTPVGSRMGRRLAEILAGDGYVVISGLALGCDTAGHEGALDAGGRTVAVMATPPDGPIYPSANRQLAERILEGGGALVSEYAPGSAISKQQLPGNLVARDEWQPALADGLVVVESDKDGGTRHAVGHAMRTGVPVAAFDYTSRSDVDFERDPRFSGNVKWLGEGARGIYEPETIEDFKRDMADYRKASLANGAEPQMSLDIA